MGVDNHAVVDAFISTHGLPVGLFDLQVDLGFWLSLRWLPAADSQSPTQSLDRGGPRSSVLKIGDAPTIEGILGGTHRRPHRIVRECPATGTGEKRGLPFYIFVRGTTFRGR